MLLTNKFIFQYKINHGLKWLKADLLHIYIFHTISYELHFVDIKCLVIQWKFYKGIYTLDSLNKYLSYKNHKNIYSLIGSG